MRRQIKIDQRHSLIGKSQNDSPKKMEDKRLLQVLEVVNNTKKDIIERNTESINTSIDNAIRNIIRECAQDIAVLGDVYNDELKAEKDKREAAEVELQLVKQDFATKYGMFEKFMSECIVRVQYMEVAEKAYLEKIAYLEQTVGSLMGEIDHLKLTRPQPRNFMQEYMDNQRTTSLSPYSEEFLPPTYGR